MIISTPIALVYFMVALWYAPFVHCRLTCKETKHGVDSGLVRVPDFQDTVPANVSCSWVYSAPQSKKLLVKVDNVHLPPTELRDSSLKLILDNQVIDIPRNCVRSCSQQLSGHSLQVIYSSVATNPQNGNDSVGSFQVRYKSFDPNLCDKPRSFMNGFSTFVGRKLGSEAEYHCNPPYDMVGKSTTSCQIPLYSPVPEWIQPPPKCVIWDCKSGSLIRRAGSGAISSPGYPDYVIESGLNCQYKIQAKMGYQLSSKVTFVELIDGTLDLFDGEEESPMVSFNSSLDVPKNLTTKSNSLTVVFRTKNKGVSESGFYLEYAAIPGVCKEPPVPDQGGFVGYSFGVGSIIAYHCEYGFQLEGDSTSECLEDGSWSGETPSCVETNRTSTLQDIGFSENYSEQLPDDMPLPTSAMVTQTEQPFSSTTVITQQAIDKFNSTGLDYSPVEEIPPKVPNKASKKTLFKIPLKSTPKPKETSKIQEVVEDEITNSTLVTLIKKADNKTEIESEMASSSNGISPKDTLEKGIKIHSVRGPKAHHSPNGYPVQPELRHEVDESNPNVVHPHPSHHDSRPIGTGKHNHPPPEEEISSLVLYGIIGSSVGALMIIIAIVATLVVYRKKFPVRMRFGRKFSTFENPMYSSGSGSKEQDGAHPRELKRLTAA